MLFDSVQKRMNVSSSELDTMPLSSRVLLHTPRQCTGGYRGEQRQQHQSTASTSTSTSNSAEQGPGGAQLAGQTHEEGKKRVGCIAALAISRPPISRWASR